MASASSSRSKSPDIITSQPVARRSGRMSRTTAALDRGSAGPGRSARYSRHGAPYVPQVAVARTGSVG
eukprot:14945788-Alexandrium_andersonii.AAC.1